MTSELTLYTNPQSRGRIARWMLEEVGVPYKTKLMEYPQLKSADYLSINPMGKVPALKHGDVIVTETAAICAYLADAFPEAKLAPPHNHWLRGPYYRWLFFAAGPVEAAASNKAMGFVVPPEREGMMGYGNHQRVMGVLEEAISKTEFILGDQFTAADVYVGSHVGYGMSFGTIEKRPAFLEYWSRINKRPAALRAAQIDDELLAARAEKA